MKQDVDEVVADQNGAQQAVGVRQQFAGTAGATMALLGLMSEGGSD